MEPSATLQPSQNDDEDMASEKSPCLEEKPENEMFSSANFLGHRTRLYLLALGANLLFLSSGIFLTWSSPVVPRLLEEGLITRIQASWLGSVYSLGAAAGAGLSSWCIGLVGRRVGLALNSLLFILSWCLLFSPAHVHLLLAGRAIGGVATGASFVTVPIFVMEVADDHMRQAVGAVNEICVGLGYLSVYTLGPFLEYYILNWIFLCITLIFTAVVYWLPETPYYLVQKGKEEEALNTLKWLRGSDEKKSIDSIQDEMNTIKDYISESQKLKGSWLDLVTKRGPLKGFAICFYLMTLCQITGICFVQAWTEEIFLMARTDIIQHAGTILFAVSNILPSFFAAPIVAKWGAKYMVLLSTSVMGFCQLGMALYLFFCDEYGAIKFPLSMTPIALIMLFNAFFCIGVGPLVWIFFGEMFPLNLKGKGIAIVGGYGWLLGFGVIQGFHPLLQFLGRHWAIFCMFGVATLILTAIGGPFLPDTKGLSMQTIQNNLHKKKSGKNPDVEENNRDNKETNFS